MRPKRANESSTMLHRLSHAFSLLFLHSQIDDPRAVRMRGMVQGVASGLLVKGLSIGTSLISVPLTVAYLGKERYGVWMLIGSVMAWLALADLDIGNGLTNVLTAAIGSGRQRDATTYISTAFLSLFLVSGLIGISFVVAWPFIDWGRIFNVSGVEARTETSSAMAVAITLFLLGFPLSVASRVYNATQNGRVANYWAVFGSFLSLLTLLIVTRCQGGLPLLVGALSGTSLLVQTVSSIWLFTYRLPTYRPSFKLIEFSRVRDFGGLGFQFFAIQIIALCIFQTDNLLIAHFLGAEATPAYSLTYRLFDYTSVLQNLLFGYLWVAYADAIARGDIDWVSRTFRRIMKSSILLTVTIVVPLIFIARPFIRFWTGGAIEPPSNLIIWMGLWSLIHSFCNPIACLLAAASRLKYQMYYAAIVAVSNLVLSSILIPRWGISGAIGGTVICYLLFNCVPTFIDVELLLKKLRSEAGRVEQVQPTA